MNEKNLIKWLWYGGKYYLKNIGTVFYKGIRKLPIAILLNVLN